MPRASQRPTVHSSTMSLISSSPGLIVAQGRERRCGQWLSPCPSGRTNHLQLSIGSAVFFHPQCWLLRGWPKSKQHAGIPAHSVRVHQAGANLRRIIGEFDREAVDGITPYHDKAAGFQLGRKRPEQGKTRRRKAGDHRVQCGSGLAAHSGVSKRPLLLRATLNQVFDRT